MDTYGHLFPGQEADAASSIANLLSAQTTDCDETLATGTDDLTVPLPVRAGAGRRPEAPPQKKAQRQAQRAGRESSLRPATTCDLSIGSSAETKNPNPLQATGLCDPEQPESKRRARDSNPQPLAGQLISNQSASHSLTLLGCH
jgi:hypothetical protein